MNVEKRKKKTRSDLWILFTLKKIFLNLLISLGSLQKKKKLVSSLKSSHERKKKKDKKGSDSHTGQGRLLVTASSTSSGEQDCAHVQAGTRGGGTDINRSSIPGTREALPSCPGATPCSRVNDRLSRGDLLPVGRFPNLFRASFPFSRLCVCQSS